MIAKDFLKLWRERVIFDYFSTFIPDNTESFELRKVNKNREKVSVFVYKIQIGGKSHQKRSSRMSSPTSFRGFEPFDELEIDESNDNDLKLKIGKKKYIPIEEFTSIQCAKTQKSTRVRKTLISRNFHHVTVSEDAKSFLYGWLGKKKATPDYNIRPTGPKHRQRFLCELRVTGFDYVACGNSTNKKDSQVFYFPTQCGNYTNLLSYFFICIFQANAAKDFINYLIRQGQMLPNEVPQGKT